MVNCFNQLDLTTIYFPFSQEYVHLVEVMLIHQKETLMDQKVVHSLDLISVLSLDINSIHMVQPNNTPQ